MRREHLRTIGQHPEMFQHVAGSPARRRPPGWDRRGDRQEHGGLSRRHQQLRHFYAGVIAPGTDREASRRATRHTPTPANGRADTHRAPDRTHRRSRTTTGQLVGRRRRTPVAASSAASTATTSATMDSTRLVPSGWVAVWVLAETDGPAPLSWPADAAEPAGARCRIG